MSVLVCVCTYAFVVIVNYFSNIKSHSIGWMAGQIPTRIAKHISSF